MNLVIKGVDNKVNCIWKGSETQIPTKFNVK
jgi:hypothetical protein